jgi:hypothetical protein
MALRDDLLPVFYEARQLIQDFGLRTHRVFIRTYQWSGPRPNQGDRTTVSDVEILPRPRVRETEDGYTVDKITPETSLGGYALSDLIPTPNAKRQVVFVVVDPDGNERECLTAPGQAAVNTERNFGYSLRLTTNSPRRSPV